ncbi:MAG: DUF4147 domain-containing protein, partial [Zestosphaera sp.]
MRFIQNFNELAVSPLHKTLLEVVEDGLSRADPYDAVIRNLSVREDKLILRGYEISIPECVHVVGFGKASAKMLRALQDLLNKVVCGGVVVTPDLGGWVGFVELLPGDPPLPTTNNFASFLPLLPS